MEEAIRALQDDDAIRILSVIAKNELAAEESGAEIPAGLEDALANEFNISVAGESVSDGEMARQALLLLSHDSKYEEVISTMTANVGHRTKEFAVDPITAIALPAICIMVLKSYVRVEYNKENGWIFEFESKPLDKEILKSFVEKFVGFFTKGS